MLLLLFLLLLHNSEGRLSTLMFCKSCTDFLLHAWESLVWSITIITIWCVRLYRQHLSCHLVWRAAYKYFSRNLSDIIDSILITGNDWDFWQELIQFNSNDQVILASRCSHFPMSSHHELDVIGEQERYFNLHWISGNLELKLKLSRLVHHHPSWPPYIMINKRPGFQFVP